MNTTTMTLEDIRRAGLEALSRELGPVGMVRFLQQFEKGQGNFSSDRHEWLGGLTLDAIAGEIRQRENH